MKKSHKPKSKNLSSEVLSQIKSGQVKMKSKSHFIIGSMLLGLGLAGALVVAFTFLTISTFHLRTANPIAFLRYGSLGGPAFIKTLPFMPILISIIGIFGGLALLKKYDISYKKSFLGISIAVVTALAVLAVLADRVGVNDKLQRAKQLTPIYKQRYLDGSVIMGEVIDIGDNSIVISDPKTNKETTITWDESTRLPDGASFNIGDHVGAFGTQANEEFQAEGIHQGGGGWKKPGPNPIPDDNPKPMVKGAKNKRFQP